MKTPEEIKQALKLCGSGCRGCSFECPYNSLECVDEMSRDALTYIQQLENQLREATKKVEQLEAAQPKWISVEDRLPNAGEKVIVCGVKNGMQVGAFSGLSHPEKTRMWWWKKNTILEVTHWMPLPSTEGIE